MTKLKAPTMRKWSFLFIAFLFQIFKICAQPPRIDKNIVMDFFQNMQYEEAISYLTAAEKLDSLNLQILGYLGYAYHMNDDLNNAAKYYQKMLNVDSGNVPANQYFSNIYSNTDPEAALRYTRRLMNSNPLKAVYYRKMGDLFRRRNQKDSALIYCEQAFRLSPNDNRNGSALADVLIDHKNYLRADSIIDDGIVKDSLSIPYLKLRVRSSYEKEAYRQVLIPGERLMRLGEVSLTTCTQVALSYYNLKSYKDCIRVCDFLVEKGMAGENVYYYAAKSHAKLREFDLSNELLRTCLELAISKTAEYYFHALGENYEEMKQFKKAIAHYDTAYYLFKDPLMLYNCGRIQDESLKNYNAAKKYFSRYVALAKPRSMAEKKAYSYVRKKYFAKKEK
jgi:tetratricopeptide (TPR) repeat protein